eukprot:gnl/MRDRNA2_/MRDRNA2_138232_c0_seq1.p1 gnl/MRDRNA2_/MRDRNA2_138232_c0~~gnl/MRDRNA2_/MRDRNA2_138232_c0_seq1.p1  ORF type:complete len:1066 (-),score=216.03 gnl/MRDRNA2_/MRDRNA2_138232_c0_seq1:204-2930(-)
MSGHFSFPFSTASRACKIDQGSSQDKPITNSISSPKTPEKSQIRNAACEQVIPRFTAARKSDEDSSQDTPSTSIISSPQTPLQSPWSSMSIRSLGKMVIGSRRMSGLTGITKKLALAVENPDNCPLSSMTWLQSKVGRSEPDSLHDMSQKITSQEISDAGAIISSGKQTSCKGSFPDIYDELGSARSLVRPPPIQTRTEEAALPKEFSDAYLEPATPDEVIEAHHEQHQIHFCDTSLPKLRRYFIMHDDDNSGKLDVAELQSVIDDLNRLPKNEQDKATLETAKKLLDDGDGELDFGEFQKVMAFYYFGVYDRVFTANCTPRQSSAEGSDEQHNQEPVLPFSALKVVLHQIYQAGFEISYELIDHFLEKVQNVAAANGNACMVWSEFLELMKHYRRVEFDYLDNMAGFAPSEVDALKELFHIYDMDNSGSLNIREIVTLMNSTKRPIQNMEAFVELFARVDVDKTAELDFKEFLHLNRIYSKKMVRDQHAVGDNNAKRKSHKASLLRQKTSDVSCMLRRQESILKIDKSVSVAEEKDIHDQAAAREVEDALIAKQFDLSSLAVRVLRESFEFVDLDAAGSVDVSEFKNLLSAVGNPASTKIQEEALNQSTQHLQGAMEFKAYVRVLKEYIKKSAEKAFGNVVGKSKGTQTGLPPDKLMMAFYQMGQYISPERLDELKEEAKISKKVCTYDMKTFIILLDLQMNRSLIEWRKCYGFTEADVQHFREVCDAYREPLTCSQEKEKMNQWVSLHVIPNVLHDLDMGGPLDMKTCINALIRAEHFYDAPEGKVHFEDVLLLLRHVENRRVAAEKKAEEQAIVYQGIDDATVKLFRSKFDDYKDSSRGFGKNKNKITRKQIQVLLVSDCKVVKTQQQRKMLLEVFDEVLGKDNDLLSFRDFLSLLSRLDSTGLF